MLTEITYTEDQLVAQLKQKDATAFAYLYDNYAGALNGIIFKMVNNSAISEDILQDAMLRIWNYIENYDTTKGRLFTWMVKLTKNLTIDFLRSKDYKKQSKISKDENSVIDLTDNKNVTERLDKLDLRKKVYALDEKQRVIIDMSYFQGYTQEEIAKELDIPLGTVKTRMRNAILELRKVLN